jgi:hypothetical protein
MRRYGFLLLCTLALAALAAAVAATMAGAKSTPQIRAAQAHERAVMAQVDAIGKDLQLAEDQLANAQQRLALVNQSLKRNEYRLHVAKGNLKAAQHRVMQRLYSLYVNGAPSNSGTGSSVHQYATALPATSAFESRGRAKDDRGASRDRRGISGLEGVCNLPRMSRDLPRQCRRSQRGGRPGSSLAFRIAHRPGRRGGRSATPRATRRAGGGDRLSAGDPAAFQSIDDALAAVTPSFTNYTITDSGRATRTPMKRNLWALRARAPRQGPKGI